MIINLYYDYYDRIQYILATVTGYCYISTKYYRSEKAGAQQPTAAKIEDRGREPSPRSNLGIY